MGLFSSVGSFLNDITGASSSASSAQRYALEQMAMSNKYQKEFAQNAHQWEVQDLQKAKLNPILSAGGQGATASGGQTGAGATGQSGINPIDIISTLSSAKQMMSQGDLNEAQTLKTLTENGLLPKSTAAQIAKDQAITKYTNERARGYSESESGTNDVSQSSTDGEVKIVGNTYRPSHSASQRNQYGYSKSRTW